MLSSFLSNNLIFNKASLEIFPCKWSAVAGVSFVGFGGCGSLGGALILRSAGLWNVGGIAVLGPRCSGSARSVLFGDIGQAGSGIYVWGVASVFQFGSHSSFS